MILFLKQTQKEATVCHPWHPWTSRKMLGFLFLSLPVFFVLFCFVFQTVQQVRLLGYLVACTEQIGKLQRKKDENSQVLLTNTNNL